MLGGDSKVVAQQLRDLSAASQCFKVKGGGHIIALYGVLTSASLKVSEVEEFLVNRNVSICTGTVRTALNQLADMGILEKKCTGPARNSPIRYQRKLNEAARALMERQAKHDPLGRRAKREKRAILDGR